MSAAAATVTPRAVRVRIAAATPARESALARMVIRLGHAVVTADGAADVVLSERVLPPYGSPAVVIGGGFEECEGRLPEGASDLQIDAALRAVAAGLRVEPAASAARSFGAADEMEEVILLTPRETEVLQAVSLGRSNKEIARELDISLHTVKFHLESLMRKLGVTSRTQAATKAMRVGLLEVFRA